MIARILAQHMQGSFGRPFVVENRGGGGGSIGTNYAARAANNGYTLLVGTVSSHVINPLINPDAAHDTEKDFQPVSMIVRLPNLAMVNPSVPVQNISELIAYARENPGRLSYGSSGAGTSSHLSAEMFQMMTETQMAHVPFKSTGEVVTSLAGGHIDLAFDNMTSAWPQAEGGAVRALAVTTPMRSDAAPEVPTVAETVEGFEATAWQGLFVPAGTPQPIVDKLAAEVQRILELPEVVARLKELGAMPSATTPDEFAEYIQGERGRWAEVVKAAGLSD
ncbi:tripartite tricarboxylate transporter substrate binding protein [Telmatospirillum sp. J64-1]|uniref:Bug family tripartite tricarboxylate transporter substrate binding protein n=1 Tax=Telmatospirillum sp. J64-1 TaxID=2502183 RepID=UPI001C8F3FA5|nr:tripartite tricarboxylate transporter substrate binding protein [Telmatospirillum sp. J64-1]